MMDTSGKDTYCMAMILYRVILPYSPSDSTSVNLSPPPKQENRTYSRIQSKIDRLQREIERFWTEIFSLIALYVESRSRYSSVLTSYSKDLFN